jgi:hypothetical protein
VSGLAGLAVAVALVVGAWPAARPGSVSGRVEGPGGPLAGATVRVQATGVSTRTDRAGRFTLPGSPLARLTASHPGFLITGGPPAATLRLRPLPEEDHDGYAWVDPTPSSRDEQRCGNCHAEMYAEWKSSRHSRSATSRHFLGLYDDLLRDHPDGSGVCASCHAPTAAGDAVFDLRQLKGVAANGVHCDYCHKVRDLNAGEVGLSHGKFLLKTLRPREGQLFFGPLDDVDRGEDAHAPIYRDSRYCAACHEGVVFGVRVYSTYSEWRDSPAARAGQHCQHCHMKPTGRMTNIAPGHGGLHRDPATLGNHRFWDGSQLDMLRRSLRLDVSRDGRRVTTRLVAENVGHRVPTGFIDRQLLLVVEAFDDGGKPIALTSGPILPAAAGDLAGRPGLVHARWPADTEGRRPVPFWRALPEVEDTRLIPHRADERVFTFVTPPARVRLRVLHRRFWAEVRDAKHWTDRDLVVLDRAD